MNSKAKMVDEKTNARRLFRHSSFVILRASSFGFRHSNHAR